MTKAHAPARTSPTIVCTIFAPLAAAAFAALHSPALAQPEPREAPQAQPAGEALPERPLQQALDESTARSRLLVVVSSPTREKEKANRALWASPALQHWVRAHAVLVHVRDQPTLNTLKDAGLIVGLPDQPLLFKAGKQERIFGSLIREDSGAPGGVRLRPAPAPAAKSPKPRDARPDAAIRLMLRLEWTRQGLATADTAWAQSHDTLNPPPAAPKLAYFSRSIPNKPDKTLGDPEGGIAGKPSSVTRFALATLLVDSAPDAKPAANLPAVDPVDLFTWLWERGPEHQPTFAGPALSSLPRRWHALAATREPFRARAVELRDAAAATLPATDYRGWFEWLLLSRIAGEQLELLDFLDAALDDPDAKKMMPAADRAAIEAMLPWLNWADPREIPGASGNPIGPLTELRRRAEAKPPAGTTPEQWWSAQQFFNWMLHVQCSRVYASMLAADQPKHAAAAADLLREASPADAAAWLTTAALCESQPRAEQADWLAAAGDDWSKALAGYVQSALANPPK